MDIQDTTKVPTGLSLYTMAAQRAAREVIYSYSTSFGLATRLLGKNFQGHVENIYALVRVADEIVDGSAAQARELSKQVDPEQLLAEFEAETYRAMDTGYSTNLIIHAFAQTARAVGIAKDIVEPFFYSMRQDLTEKEHDQASFEKYVYGSAEVVGLMCLQVFMSENKYTDDEKIRLTKGARALGSAFQKVNFLRDLAADFKRLGRSYFPSVDVNNFNEETKQRLVADIDKDLRLSAESLPLLPSSARRAVAAAQLLFTQLNRQISKTSAQELINRRISVGAPQKLALLIKAVIGVKV
ncbi:MAG: phytoene/squalene synthase family protein [Aquiluna sp.]